MGDVWGLTIELYDEADDNLFSRIDSLPNIVFLRISNDWALRPKTVRNAVSEFSVIGLQDISVLANLRDLTLEGTPVTDLRGLAQCKNLEWLDLQSTAVSPDQIKAIKLGLPNCYVKISANEIASKAAQ